MIPMLLALVATTAGGAGAQQQPGPVQTVGVIAGTVVVKTGESATPLRRATVVLVGGPVARVATTDDDGRFEFNRVSAGRFQVSARTAGYVGGRLGVGPGRLSPGEVIALGPSDWRHEVTLELARGATIAGRVFGPQGEPWPAASVALLRRHRFGNDTSLAKVASTRTDDRGDYRFFGLLPGTYVVAASNSQADADGVLSVPASWLDTPAARKPGEVGVQPGEPAVQVTLAPTYHPGEAESSSAQPISVRLDEDRVDVNVGLRQVPAATISGALDLSAGTVAGGANVQLRSEAIEVGLRTTSFARLIVRPDGSFRSGPLSPGRYELHVRAKASDGSALWAVVEAQMRGSDIRLPVISLLPPIRLTGALNGGAGAAGGRVRLLAADASNPPVTAVVNGEGQFVADGLLPGRYRVEVTSGAGRLVALVEPFTTLPSTSAVATTTLDVLATPATVRGTVRDSAGSPVSDYTIIVFSAEPTRWRPDAPTTKLVRPDGNGTYLFEGLPPGAYVLAVLTDIDEGTLSEPTVFQALTDAGVAVTAGPSDTTIVNLVVPVR